jgi:hypothetical protein
VATVEGYMGVIVVATAVGAALRQNIEHSPHPW